MLSNKSYDVLKWTFLLFTPALAVLVGVLGETWGLPNTEQWVTTINALSVFGGAILGISNYNYNKEG